MTFRPTIVLPVALLGVALFASPMPAQVRGMRGSAPAPRTRVSFGVRGRTGSAFAGRRRDFGGSAFLAAPYFYPYDDYVDEPVTPEAPPVQVIVERPAQPPVPAP